MTLIVPSVFNADLYCQQVLANQRVDTSITSPIYAAALMLFPILQSWGNGRVLDIHPSGSYAKGTANRRGTDIDLFISLSEDTTETLAEIHNKLFTRLTNEGYTPKRQNVSLGIRMYMADRSAMDVDLVPGKRQNLLTFDHSLYCKANVGGWTKTNVRTHIAYVQASGQQDVIRLVKLWRQKFGLEFHSFYLELTVINALRNSLVVGLAQKFAAVLHYLNDSFTTARVIDPANASNIISDEHTAAQKAAIKATAARALSTPWDQLFV